jgi:hypothetical protein
LVGGFAQQFQQGFFPNQEWQQMSYAPPAMMMGYAPNPMIDHAGPHGLKRQRDG